MDLRNLSSTPNQLEAVFQRRTSLSSLSSTSGYDMSYADKPQANNPQMGHRMGIANPSAQMYTGSSANSSNTNLVPASESIATDVGPWVEQQKQQQSLTGNPLDKKDSLSAPIRGVSNTASTASDDREPPTNSNDDDEENDVDDDELIPTAIVIKNIPFAIKKEQLLDVMTKLNLPLPYAFNYHFDNGVFRGLAFANFTSTDETSMVVNHLNGREIGGRRLRVEYKKMLPLQERERIEREKREKRGQLEEQHRSNSNASLASLLSVTSTTAATKNLSVNGQTYSTQTERLFVHFPNGNSFVAPADLNFNDPEILELYSQLLTYRDDNSKLIFELAFPSTLSMTQRKALSQICSFLNLLELFDNGLIIIRRKPGQQTIQQRQQQNASYNAHLSYQQNPATAASPSAAPMAHPIQPSVPSQGQQQSQNGVNSLSSHSSSMMNLSQMPTLLYSNSNINQSGSSHPPELLRSQSQSALPMPRLSRQQNSTPVQHSYSQHQPSASHQQKQGSQHGKYQSFAGYNGSSAGTPTQSQAQVNTPTPSSAAALLRSSNNRSFVDVRASPALNNSFHASSVTGSPTPQNQGQMYPQQGNFYPSSQISQPGNSMNNSEINNRFAPFGQHAQLSGSLSSLQPNSATTEEFPLGDPLNSKFGSMNLGGGFEQKGNNIWGTKK